MRDSILLDKDKMEKITKIQKEGKEPDDPNDKREVFEKKRDNFAGQIMFTYSNFYLTHLLYHEQFRQSQK